LFSGQLQVGPIPQAIGAATVNRVMAALSLPLIKVLGQDLLFLWV